MIAEKYHTDHHKIKRILEKENIKITRRNTLKKFTQEHKDKISSACRGRKVWSTGKKMPMDSRFKNMKNHLKYDVDLVWLSGFDDIEKLKYLNHSISRKRDYAGFTTEIYQQFIERFYYDKKFNILYKKWIETKDKWIKPSLDHVESKARGGTLLLNNLQFISWFENRAKVDIPQCDWDIMKKRVKYYL